MKTVSVVAMHIIQYCALTLSSSGIYNDPQKRRGIGKTSDLMVIYSGRQQKKQADYLRLVTGRIKGRLGDDRAENGAGMGAKWRQKQHQNR